MNSLTNAKVDLDGIEFEIGDLKLGRHDLVTVSNSVYRTELIDLPRTPFHIVLKGRDESLYEIKRFLYPIIRPGKES